MDITVKVEAGEQVRLDRYLRRMGWHFPQNLFEKWGRQKKMCVNKAPVKGSCRVRNGDVISIPDDAISVPVEQVTPLTFSFEEARDILTPMIVFENEDFLVLDKPHGIAVQGGTGQRTSIDALLQAYSHQIRFRLTHRIDKETSGLLLIAKTSFMATTLTNMFRDRVIEKTYRAVCYGNMAQDDGEINHPIQKVSRELRERSSDRGGKKTLEKVIPVDDGKEAITHFKVIHRYDTHTSVELHPKTGRMHQLRVHLAMIGHPIVHDKKYEDNSSSLTLDEAFVSEKRLMLHAWKLSFNLQGKHYIFEAILPKNF